MTFTTSGTPNTRWSNSSLWQTSLERLKDRPRLESLQEFMHRLFVARGDDVAFVVLYGSMARGDWSRSSDFDVLVALKSDPDARLIDRLAGFSEYSDDGWVEALPYTLQHIERMFTRFNLVVLAALRDGVVLYDDGAWAPYQRRFHALLETGQLVREHRGWSWTEEAERMARSADGVT